MNVTEYEISGCPMSVTLAVVADLHEHDPELLLQQLNRLRPQLILAVGDIFECPDPDLPPEEVSRSERLIGWITDGFGLANGAKKAKPENAFSFFRQAVKIAPIIYARGNHEQCLPTKIRAFLTQNNITLLENRDISWSGLWIGGTAQPADSRWLDEFSSRDGYKILLNHRPEEFTKGVRLTGGKRSRPLAELSFDLVISGHAHGGQMRLPAVVFRARSHGGETGFGLFAPGQGFFPRYTKGIYEGHLAVSVGCANTVSLPRIGNPTELMVLQLHP